MHFFTSANLNYLPKARVLAESVKRFHPDAMFTLVLSERLNSDSLNIKNEPFDQILHVEDLNIPTAHLPSWVFGHSVVELCTAVKPFACQEIFRRNNADTVVYLDPDIQVYDSLNFMEDILKSHGVLLTPHMLAPAVSKEEVEIHEISCLRHGTFNLGFIAIQRQRGKQFLDWWCERLLHFCHDDIPRGLFTDQRWIDLAPSLFEEVHVLRDNTCNVASWNVSRRKLILREKGKYEIDGRPLRFFHFSGFDSGTHDRIIKLMQPENDALTALTQEYRNALHKAGQNDFKGHAWSYQSFENGNKIQSTHRVNYRRDPELSKRFPDPFLTNTDGGGYFAWCKRHLDNPLGKIILRSSSFAKRMSKRIRARVMFSSDV